MFVYDSSRASTRVKQDRLGTMEYYKFVDAKVQRKKQRELMKY